MTSILASLALLAGLSGPAHAAAPEIHYAPEERLDRIDAELINNAEMSIDIAAYVLTDWEVIDALDNAAARGGKVRVILDPRAEGLALCCQSGRSGSPSAPGTDQGLDAIRTNQEHRAMDDRDRLAFYPFVIVRIACRVCSRNGAYRLTRLAAKFGPEIGLRDLLDRFSSAACGARRPGPRRASQPAASTCRTLSSLGRPTCRAGSCGSGS
jgi:hypothetical protein